MKKIIFGLVLVGITVNFSFYKMSDIFECKLYQKDNKSKTTTCNRSKKILLSNIKEIGTTKDCSKIVCNYNTHLGYGLFNAGFYLHQSDKGNTHTSYFVIANFNLDFSNVNWIDQLKDTVVPSKNINCYLQPIYSPIHNLLESNKKLERDIKIEFWTDIKDTHTFEDGRIRMIRDIRTDNVKFKNLTTDKTIKFKKALKNYINDQKKHYDQYLFQHVTNLAKNFLNPTLNNRNKLITKSVSEIKKLNQFRYTEDQIKLLKNSNILEIYAFPPKKISNKAYVKDWNKRHPHDRKKVEYKIINSIIIGYARDKITNEEFHWITDLGQDVSILFDYDTKKRKREN